MEKTKITKAVREVSNRVYKLQSNCTYDLKNLPDTHSLLKEAEILCKRNGVKFKVLDNSPEINVSFAFKKDKAPTLIVEKPKSKQKVVNDKAGEMAIKLFGAYSKYQDSCEIEDFDVATEKINNMTGYSSVFFKGWTIGKKYIKKPAMIG